jgi:hypothetical protein
MDVRNRLDYARRVRGRTRHQVFLQLKETGQSVPNKTKRDVYAFFSETTRKSPPLPTLEALAFVLRVRVPWLAFGDGPMEAGVPADSTRELFLIDGASWRFNPFLDPQKRNLDRQSFQAAFRSAEGFERLSRAAQAAFCDHMARHFEATREAGTYQDNAGWRGQEAATQFIRALDIIRYRTQRQGGAHGDPYRTAAVLWALGSLELQRSPEG